MLFNVMERILLVNGLLPAQGSFANLMLLNKAREELSFDEKENEALAFHQEGEMVRWNEVPGIPDKEVEIGKVVSAIIKKALVELDKEEKLSNDHVSLYQRFVLDDE